MGFVETASGRTEGVERPKLADFEGLYHQYSKRVYSLCLRMTRNEADAQDLMQEAFIQLFRKLDTFRGESAFYTWLYRLVVNIALMQLRRKRRLMETSLEGSPDADHETRLPPHEFAVRDNRLHGVIDKVSFERALQALPLGFRRVFVLHDLEGYEHHEISKMVACSVGTSKSQLHRARLRLRKLLAPCSDRRPRPGSLPAGKASAARRWMAADAWVHA